MTGPRVPVGPLLWLTVWMAAVLVLSAVVFPSFRAPDEVAHFDRVVGIAESPQTAVDRYRPVAERVRGAARAVGMTGAAGDVAPLTAADADRRPLEAFRTADDTSGIRNQMTQHPPAYYLLAAAVLQTLEGFGAGWSSVVAAVLALRLLGVALVLFLPALTIIGARQWGLDAGGSVAAGICVAAVPMLAHIGASVNNDTLLIGLGGVLTAQLLCVATAPSTDRARWASAPVVGLTALIALLTKGFALIVLGWLPLAYVVAPDGWRQRLHDLLLALTISSVGLAWWVRNLAVEGIIQPDHTALPSAVSDFAVDTGWWVAFGVRRLVQRFWVEPDIATDITTYEPVAAVVLTLLVVSGSVIAMRRDQRGPAAVLLFPSVALFAVMTFGAWQLYTRTGQPFGIHGRYLYPALPGMGILAGATVSALPSSWRWGTVSALLLVATAYQIRVLLAALTFYWGPRRRGGLSDALAAVEAWTPLPISLLLVTGATLLVAVVALMAMFVRRQMAA